MSCIHVGYLAKVTGTIYRRDGAPRDDDDDSHFDAPRTADTDDDEERLRALTALLTPRAPRCRDCNYFVTSFTNGRDFFHAFSLYMGLVAQWIRRRSTEPEIHSSILCKITPTNEYSYAHSFFWAWKKGVVFLIVSESPLSSRRRVS